MTGCTSNPEEEFFRKHMERMRKIGDEDRKRTFELAANQNELILRIGGITLGEFEKRQHAKKKELDGFADKIGSTNGSV
jgi:hypothetical protein